MGRVRCWLRIGGVGGAHSGAVNLQYLNMQL